MNTPLRTFSVHLPKPLDKLLSPAEFETLKLLATGQGVADIARARFRSVKTVSTQQDRIKKKLGLAAIHEVRIVGALLFASLQLTVNCEHCGHNESTEVVNGHGL